MKIQSLLNSPCRDQYDCSDFGSPPFVSVARTYTPLISLPKRQRIAKDAPVFSEGNEIHGHVNYPPYEADEADQLITQHQSFYIYPLGEIYKKGVRHVPYNSDKKDFLHKTGREAFEMFQYTYRTPKEPKDWTVVWDYNVGLVRITPFFKSLGHSKITPSKALKENPGLPDISYSITGGALVCQGYWVPYQAAKALASKFCYPIRWALTPVFGKDFPDMCLKPNDPEYEKFAIDPDIVVRCTEETQRFKKQGAAYRIKALEPETKAEEVNIQFISPSWALHDQKPDYPALVRESEDSDSPLVSPCCTDWRPSFTSRIHLLWSDRRVDGYTQEELDAAEVLTQLSAADWALRPAKRVRRSLIC